MIICGSFGVRRLIDRAATATGKNRSEFMLNAAGFATEEALLDKVLFRVDAKTHDGLMAYLDEPPSAQAGLRKLMRTAAVRLTPTAPIVPDPRNGLSQR